MHKEETRNHCETNLTQLGRKKTQQKLVPYLHLHRVEILPLITSKMRCGSLKYSRWSVSLVCRSCSVLERHGCIKIWPMLKELRSGRNRKSGRRHMNQIRTEKMGWWRSRLKCTNKLGRQIMMNTGCLFT